MPRRRRPLVLVTLAVASAVDGCGANTDVRSTRADPIGASTDTTSPSGTAPTDSTPEPASALKWANCDDPNAQDPALECATLTVPLDYDKPKGDSIDLALIRTPATGDRKGAVLFNPGGPGGSGFDPI